MSALLSYFPGIELTPDQKEALDKIEKFFNDTSLSVFILKGYAGTGKTTLIKGIYKYLTDQKRFPFVMAPTGRAAKVLRDKLESGLPATIHKTIYEGDLELINQDKDLPEHVYKYHANVRDTTKGALIQSRNIIALIDEASMISSCVCEQELIQFGTDCLLDDIITFIRPECGGKVIFVGDPMQLPPVTDRRSAALDETFFAEKGLSVDSFEMRNVVRQSNESIVLANAAKLRSLYEQKVRNELVFDMKEGEVEEISSDEVVEHYCCKANGENIDNSITICYSNRDAAAYNVAIRQRLFPHAVHAVEGDRAIVVQNNYIFDLFNGDMVVFGAVSDEVETLTAPVVSNAAGEKVRLSVSLNFRKVFLHDDTGKVVESLMIDSLLENDRPMLTIDEMKALYINFCMRMQRKKIYEGSAAFRDELKQDPYVNALRLKYGYAVTCHKSQGGEWNTVYVNFTDRLGLNNDCLRWMYTAVTRCKKHLYGVSIPHITYLSKFKIDGIAKVSKAPVEAICFGNPSVTPFHSDTTLACKREKYWEITDKLSDSLYKIDKVKSDPYMEEYYISTGEGVMRFDTIHDGAGFFHPFTASDRSVISSDILSLLNASYAKQREIAYSPANYLLAKLYQKVLCAANECEVSITNVIDNPSSYCVTYYFTTSGRFSYIQFYYNKNFSFTRAMPKSDLGDDDEKLKLLISKLL